MKPKGGQFSQLTLGSIEPSFNVKPTDEHRWPRGYTPERQAATAEVFDSPRQFAVTNGVSGSVHRLRARVIDTVARSDADLSKIGHNSRLVSPWPNAEEPVRLTHETPNIHHDTPKRGILGSYGAQSGAGEDVGDVTMYPQITLHGDTTNPLATPEQQHTLLHELGHHVSAVEGNEHSPAASLARSRLKGENSGGNFTAMRMGKEEGFADRHAAETMNPRRGDKPYLRGAYPASAYGFYGGKEKTFDKHYAEAHYDNPLSSGATPRQLRNSTAMAVYNHVEADRGYQPELNSDNTRGKNPDLFGERPQVSDFRKAGRQRHAAAEQALQRLNDMGYRGHHTTRPSR